jgi:hypothetical protein
MSGWRSLLLVVCCCISALTVGAEMLPNANPDPVIDSFDFQRRLHSECSGDGKYRTGNTALQLAAISKPVLSGRWGSQDGMFF